MTACIIEGNSIVFSDHTVYLDNFEYPEGSKDAQEYVNDMALELLEWPDDARSHAEALRHNHNDGSWRLKFHKSKPE